MGIASLHPSYKPRQPHLFRGGGEYQCSVSSAPIEPIKSARIAMNSMYLLSHFARQVWITSINPDSPRSGKIKTKGPQPEIKIGSPLGGNGPIRPRTHQNKKGTKIQELC